jgi:DNA-binding HxlR family transcriptional regulator
LACYVASIALSRKIRGHGDSANLHRDGLIERKAYLTIPPRVEYTNTALGRSLAKAMGPLVRWAEENQPTVDLNPVEYEKRERKRANLPL